MNIARHISHGEREREGRRPVVHILGGKMGPRILAIMSVIVLLSLSASAQDRSWVRKVYEKVKNGVVVIRTDQGQGSGCLVDPAGRILTNYHVVEGAREVEVRLVDGRIVPVRSLGSIDPIHDLAVLVVDLPRDWRPHVLRLGNPETAREGDEVLTVGAPLGLEASVTNGVISGLRTNQGRREIQITAPISPGNSGGALVNRQGELIGLPTSTMRSGQNLNFAIPVSYARLLLASPDTQSLAVLAPLPGMDIPATILRVDSGSADYTAVFCSLPFVGEDSIRAFVLAHQELVARTSRWSFHMFANDTLTYHFVSSGSIYAYLADPDEMNVLSESFLGSLVQDETTLLPEWNENRWYRYRAGLRRFRNLAFAEIEADPTRLSAWIRIAESSGLLHDAMTKDKAYEKIRALDPRNPIPAVLEARFAQQAKNSTLALLQVRRADSLFQIAGIDPANESYAIELADLGMRVALAMGDNVAAMDRGLDAVRRWPGEPAPRRLLANAMENLGRLDEAWEQAWMGLRLSTDPDNALMSFVRLSIDSDHLDHGVKAARLALDRFGERAEILRALLDATALTGDRSATDSLIAILKEYDPDAAEEWRVLRSENSDLISAAHRKIALDRVRHQYSENALRHFMRLGPADFGTWGQAGQIYLALRAGLTGPALDRMQAMIEGPPLSEYPPALFDWMFAGSDCPPVDLTVLRTLESRHPHHSAMPILVAIGLRKTDPEHSAQLLRMVTRGPWQTPVLTMLTATLFPVTDTLATVELLRHYAEESTATYHLLVIHSNLEYRHFLSTGDRRGLPAYLRTWQLLAMRWNNEYSTLNLAWALILNDRGAEALALVKALDPSTLRNDHAHAVLGITYLVTGHRTEAEKMYAAFVVSANADTRREVRNQYLRVRDHGMLVPELTLVLDTLLPESP